MKKEMFVYLRTFGCQMNEYDSARILRVLEDLDYLPVREPEKADLILLNTCSVRAKSEHKAVSELGRFRSLKSRRKGLVVGVGGCVAQQEGRALLNRMPYLDLVFGTQAIDRLPQLLRRVTRLGERVVDVDPLENGEPRTAGDDSDRTRQQGVCAYLTVMRGCDNFCSFCIVPYVRGRESSREPEKIIREAEALVERGVREVMLLGQNVNSYGKKLSSNVRFPDLLRLVNKVEGLFRLRFTTSHPKDFGEDLIEAVASLEKMCEWIHLPFQSGSDKVLAAMNRGYTASEYLDKVRRLRQAVPDAALSSDVIVGFPGETRADFESTMDLLREIRFDGLFSFHYSPRPQTRASRLIDDVPMEEKSERLATLQDLQRRITMEKNEQMKGSIQEVLIEGWSKTDKTKWSGRARNNRIVNFTAEGVNPGELVKVKITRALANSLAGTALDSP